MTDAEVVDLLLHMFEGLDIIAEQMDILVSLFGEVEAPVRPLDEVDQEENETGFLRALPGSHKS